MTQEQALAKARATGKAVPVDGATTPTSTVSANPDGSLTLTSSAAPVRKRVGQEWLALDPVLRLTSDGTIVPGVTTSSVVLSDGGTGPLAVLDNGGRRMSLQAPMTLPRPTLSGATATYTDVLPGVDLQVTVDEQGGFGQVFVVRNAAAAAALATVRIGLQTAGLTVRADTAGNLSAVDRSGNAAFTAPTPMMWDSAVAKSAASGAAPSGSATAQPGVSTSVTAAASASPSASAQPKTPPSAQATAQASAQPVPQDQGGVDPSTRRPAVSNSRGPGKAARIVALGVKVSAADIVLTPDPAVLAAADLVYPLYYDPVWTPVNVSKSAWATVPKQFHGSNYYNKTPDPTGHMQVGNSGSGGIWSHTLINFGIPSVLSGATIASASLTMTEVYSFSCAASEIDVFAPATTLTSANATWDSWSSVNLGSKVDGPVTAHGYSSGCPAASVGFNVLPAVNSAVAAHKGTQTFVFTAVDEASNTNGYKEFDAGTPQLNITYNHPPATPSGLTTSPSTDCTATTPTAVGDGNVSLYAPVSDPNGGTLGVAFQLWKASTPGTFLASSDPNVLTYPSGSTAVLVVPETVLKAAAGTPTTATTFAWHVQTTDGIVSSSWSATCSFVFDPTRPGAPVLTMTGSSTIGQPTSIDITGDAGSSTPATYTYQINGLPPVTVTATNGNATVSVTPTRFTNTVAVTAASAGGNFGDTATLTFNAAPAATQSDHDFDGDGNADLTSVGVGGTGLPAGLWLARGSSSSPLQTIAADIGVNGTAPFAGAGPAAYNGTQVVSGRFTGSGLQDVFVYYPTGANAGNAVIINGNGDGSTLQPAYAATVVYAGAITDMAGGYPTQLVNAGNAAGHNLAYPDLLGVSSDGSSLNYFPNTNFTGGYFMTYGLSTLTPTGGTDWGNWTLATSQTASGTTNMFLWNKTTGGLYFWTGVTADPDTGTLSYTAHTIAASGWNTGAVLSLQAMDVNHDGITDLRTVAGMTAKTYVTSNVTGTNATLTAQSPQTLSTATHQWTLATGTTGAATTAPDAIGTATLTGAGAAAWHTGDLFSPDVMLNVDANGAPITSPNGALVSNGRLIDTTASFSISAWAKPVAAGGVVLSEDGAHTSRFFLRLEPTDKTWRFEMATADTTGWSFDQARAVQPAQLGVWTHLEAGFDAATGIMALYVNGTLAATAHHYPMVTWPVTGNLVIGAQLNSDTRTGWYAGQIADVQTFADNHLVSGAMTPRPALPPAAGNIVDLDGDLLPDLLYLDNSGGSMYISLGSTSGGTLSRQVSTGVSSGWGTVSLFTLADWDGDGKVDVLGKNGANDLLVWRNTSTPGSFSLAAYVVLGNDWSAVTRLVTGDFNGDKKIDIAGWSTDGYTLYIIPNTSSIGSPSRGTRVAADVGWTTITSTWAAELDNDGITDLIGRNATEGFAYRVTYTGGTYHIAPRVSLGTEWGGYGRIITGDFNGDGRIDVAAFSTPNNDQLTLIPNTTVEHVLSRGPSYDVGTGWASVTAVFTSDYDLDGYTDLIGRAGDMLYAWRNVSVGNGFQVAPLTSLTGGWTPVGVFAQRR
ncbi:FG-GAP-like repeat-containing protein [Dactylosporangium sp. NPDC049525]|uniref:FG-GAP-like repeat-containing protein n=1 Tax=Dactylosporangium sp. NPDC049525 TaxID=3154730 RepID=UPI003413279F